MNKIWILFGLTILFLACSNHTEIQPIEQEQSLVYSEEKLLIDYLYKYHNNEIKCNDYWLLTFRTANICKSCRKTPLDTILKYTISEKGNSLYILVDNPNEVKNIKSQYNNNLQCLCGNAKILNQYGIPRLEPLLFHIQNKKVLDVSYYDH